MKAFGSLTHKHGVILSVNTRAEQLLGLETADLIGMNLFDFMIDEGKKEAINVMNQHQKYLLNIHINHPIAGDVNIEVWPESTFTSSQDECTVYFKPMTK
jgi:PAS domain-containing protein